MEGTIDSDSGAMIRDGIKSVGTQGDCPETQWPYNIAKFRTKPSAKCYRAAVKYKAILYQRVTQDLTQLRGCLASGFPFVFGFAVYNSFLTQQVAQAGRRREAARRATRCWRSATTTPISGSSCAIPGGRAGAWAATSRCPTPT